MAGPKVILIAFAAFWKFDETMLDDKIERLPDHINEACFFLSSLNHLPIQLRILSLFEYLVHPICVWKGANADPFRFGFEF